MTRNVEAYVCTHRKAKAKQNGSSRNESSIPESYVVFSLAIVIMKNSSEKMNARRKLDIPMPAAMPCRLQLQKYRETCCTVGQHKTTCACIVAADEFMRIVRREGSQSKNHGDHIARRGMNSFSQKSCGLIVFLCLKAMKIPDAKAAVEK